MKQKILIHARIGYPRHQQVILEEANSKGFDTLIPNGNSNPFSVEVSGEETDLYTWADTLNKDKAIVMYHDPAHSSNSTLKSKYHAKVKPHLENTISQGGTTTGGTKSAINYFSNGLYTTIAASLLYRYPQQSSKTRTPIAFVSFGGGVYPTDPQANWDFIGLTAPNIPTFTVVTLDGATNTPGVNTGADQENILDLTVIGGNCPYSAVTLFLGSGTSYADVYNVFSSPILSPIGFKAISSSWSFSGLMSNFAAADEIIYYAASKGINVTCASGDNGSPELETFYWPISSPSLIAVGGTNLTRPVLNYYTPLMNETAWGGGGFFSTGGVTVYPMPQYQKGVISSANGVVSNVFRCVPDISAYADGYVLIYNSGIIGLQGTSAAAPAIAALIALLNPGVFLPPILYANLNSSISWYHDVTQGDNIGYLCTPGYDLVTGIGSPDGLLLQQLLSTLGYI